MGAIAQIDDDDAEAAFVTLSRCQADIDPDSLATPLDPDHPDYPKYQKLDQIVARAMGLLASDPHGARQVLVYGLKEFGWADEPAAAHGQ
jgi:hypothetical protein